MVTSTGFALNYDKSLKIYFFYEKCWVKNNFLKDISSRVVRKRVEIMVVIDTPSASLDSNAHASVGKSN